MTFYTLEKHIKDVTVECTVCASTKKEAIKIANITVEADIKRSDWSVVDTNDYDDIIAYENDDNSYTLYKDIDFKIQCTIEANSLSEAIKEANKIDYDVEIQTYNNSHGVSWELSSEITSDNESKIKLIDDDDDDDDDELIFNNQSIYAGMHLL